MPVPLRLLTADEVTREINDITTRRWPLSVLFMKNLYQRHPPHIGAIIRKDNDIVPNVRIGQGQIVPYETLRAMVEDGWVVD